MERCGHKRGTFRKINFFFQAEDGIRDRSPSRGVGDVYKRQCSQCVWVSRVMWFVVTRLRRSPFFGCLGGCGGLWVVVARGVVVGGGVGGGVGGLCWWCWQRWRWCSAGAVVGGVSLIHICSCLRR